MKKRNGVIDLLKFLFAVMIVIFHSKNFVNAESEKILRSAGLGVSFFFIVSGYLMAHSARRVQADQEHPAGPLTVQFIWKKIKGMAPEFYTAWVIAFAVESFIVKNKGIAEALKDGAYGIFELLFLTMAGFEGKGILRVNHVSWYLSAMLIVMALYYPLLIKKRDTFLTLIAPLLCAFIYGYMYTCLPNGFSGPSTQVFGPIRRGLVRAAAEIALGCACYLPAQKLKRMELTKTLRLLMGAVVLLCFGMVFYQAIGKMQPIGYILAALVMAVGITLCFSEQTVWNDMLAGNRVVGWLGEFSLCLYLCHGFWSHAMSILFPEQSYAQRLAWYFLIVTLTALAVRGISVWIKKNWPPRLVNKGKP